jgi:hypothetical protein
MPLLAVLCWNLITCSFSIALLSYTHISRSGDAVKIKLPGHKGNQEGERVFETMCMQMYRIPLICPMFHLGLHIVCS